MAAEIALDYASLISIILEAILYGFSVYMFGTTMYYLVTDRTKANMRMLWVAIALFSFSTTHIGIDGKRITDALIFDREKPGGSILSIADTKKWTLIFKHGVLVAQTLLGDGVVIWRLYAVSNSIYLCALPFILWLSVIATGTSTLYHFGASKPGQDNIFASETAQWVTSFFSTTLAANLVGTSLLAYRIWDINRKVSSARTGRSSLVLIMRAVADSGTLYSATVILVLGPFLAKSNVQYIFLDMLPPTIAIAFYLIILRLTRAKQKRANASQNSRPGRATTDMHMNTVPMEPLQVRLTKSVTTVDDSRQKLNWGNSDVV